MVNKLFIRKCLFLKAKFDTEMPSETVSKIHLVDLAGRYKSLVCNSADIYVMYSLLILRFLLFSSCIV